MTWLAVGLTGASLVGSNQQRQAQKGASNKAAEISERQYNQSREDLRPQREFNQAQLSELQNWLSSPEGRFNAPTMDSVTSGAGYKSRLGAVEGSAASKGSLFSGNALRNIGEFGSQEYEKEYGRERNKYQNELSKRMGLAGLGSGAAGSSANASQNYGRSMAGNAMAGGAAEAGRWGDLTSAVGSGIGAYQGQQNWNSFLDKFGGGGSSPSDGYVSDIGWE